MGSANRVKRLLSRVRDMVRSTLVLVAPGDVETIAAGDFQIDLENRTATLRGRPLQLTGEEFDLLMFLIDHPRKLVTQQTRLATNWAGHGLRQTEFLRVLLSLRKKLDSEGSSQHYIRTEPWVFYRFDPGSLASTVVAGTPIHVSSVECRAQSRLARQPVSAMPSKVWIWSARLEDRCLRRHADWEHRRETCSSRRADLRHPQAALTFRHAGWLRPSNLRPSNQGLCR